MYAICINKNLTPTERNYTIIEKEFLYMNYAINKFSHYITGYKVRVHTNHATIKWKMNKPIMSARIIIWLLLLQEFDITIIDNPGKSNLVSDFLSRLHIGGDDELVKDELPNEKLFFVSTNTPWSTNIANFLAT